MYFIQGWRGFVASFSVQGVSINDEVHMLYLVESKATTWGNDICEGLNPSIRLSKDTLLVKQERRRDERKEKSELAWL